MSYPKKPSRPAAVPAGQFTRLMRFGGLAGGLAGDAFVRGAGKMVKGERPDLSTLLLTPQNANRVADELARMRGAAMKLGQLISMDRGDLVAPELSSFFARLRDTATPMPPRQLKKVLSDAWGPRWLSQFSKFDPEPMAAASIGQVHRARTKNGDELAIKVQYPGVRRSIDSDVDNLAGLIRLSGLKPASLDLGPFLGEAKRQLHQEADYIREAEYLRRYSENLVGLNGYRVPRVYEAFSTETILAMSFEPAEPIEQMASAPQAERDRTAERLIRLLLMELFDFHLMQTDPNFANYRIDRTSGEIVLLDFGATRTVDPAIASNYRALFFALLDGNQDNVIAAALALGFIDQDLLARFRPQINEMISLIIEQIAGTGVIDFSERTTVERLRDQGFAIMETGDAHYIPPSDILFLQRKFGGMYLLASHLGARVDVAALMEPYRI